MSIPWYCRVYPPAHPMWELRKAICKDFGVRVRLRDLERSLFAWAVKGLVDNGSHG